MPLLPGRYVTASQDGHEYRAWVPSPLPPDLSFDGPMASALADAAGALGELSGTGRNLPNPHLLLNPFLRKEAVLSSRIEGTQATIADLYAYEAAQLPLPGMRDSGTDRTGDVREVLNYVAALNHGLEAIGQDRPITLGLIEQLHRELMTGVRGRELTPGRFRERQNIIGPPGATLSNATYIPPPVVHMRDGLRELERYVQGRDRDSHRLVQLALIHYQFEAIHPFNDGNGRVGRLLVSLLITHWDLLPLPLLYLSAYFDANRNAYYDHLQAVTEEGGWREWVIFFLRGVAEQSVDAARRAKRLVDLRDLLQERAASAGVPAQSVRLAGRMVEQPIITIKAASEMLGVSYHNARRQVHRLVEIGVLNPYSTQGQRDLYIAPEVMDAVSD